MPDNTDKPNNSSPNADFFGKYGELSDPESVVSKAPFLMVRHALSVFNIHENKFNEEFQKRVPVTDPDYKQKR